MTLLSEILGQVADKNKRVIVNFEDASFSLVPANNEESFNEYERFTTPGKFQELT